VRLSKNSLNEPLTLKPTIFTMQLTTLTAMLFAAIAFAGPIAMPDNVKVQESAQLVTWQTTDEAPERHPCRRADPRAR
jgi:hypothetical protein